MTHHDQDIPTVARRFMRYVAIDTQSQEEATTYPSTEKQKDLGRLLVSELKEIGLTDAEMDEWGYVFATLPGNVDKAVPTIGLISHVDTAPAVTGKDVKPVLHRNYQGGALTLPADPSAVIDPTESPALKNCMGHDIITSDGSTLLGADDKAGVAEIMTAVEYLIAHPELKHGRVRIAFTCDEEIGRGTEHFDIEKFGAKFAYTIDGETAGEIENETFCADGATVVFKGINVHPGYAKNKLVSAIKAASFFVRSLPPDFAPETTEGRQGYLHPVSISGTEELGTVKLIVRDFEEDGLHRLEDVLRDLAERTKKEFPGSDAQVTIEEQYRNMRMKLDEAPQVVEYAMEAVKRAGAKPGLSSIRGGTDGSKLTQMGLPTPNVFTGGHNFHARTEWISIQDMELGVKTLVELVQVWSEKS
ncbi:MAG: peptidase T [Deltaproteobacteria bacterium]|nr:peptidase T [Deltaproteobacteria bacterium]